MVKQVSRGRLIGAWCAAVIVFGACGIVAGVAITISNGELLLMTCLVPSSVMLLLGRGAPPITMTESVL